MCDMSGACSTHWGHVPDGGHAAPTSWEHAEAIPGMWHMPGMVHVPVTHPGHIGGVFHMPGTCARQWAHCPHILGTHKSCPRCVALSRDSAHPSHASRMCSVCRMRLMH